MNIVGYVTGNVGLGVSTRQTLSMLKRAGVSVAATDLDPGLGRGGHDTTHNVLGWGTVRRTPHPLTIFHANPLEVAGALKTQPSLSRFDRLTAIVPFWELEILPPKWIPILAAMDFILTPTPFVRSAIEKILPASLYVDYPQMVDIDLAKIHNDRGRWGMKADKTVFVTSFDLASSMDRKNPSAVVNAFQQAFPDRSDVQLVLKANNSRAVPGESRLWSEFAHWVKQDYRIQVITEVLPYYDVLSLYASADCFISLHRSEGLGLGMMEAMLIGRPVIATGWSGNLDFMTAHNSRLVDYDLVPVVTDNSNYAGYGERGAMWAEASVSSAAKHMWEVSADPEAARALGRRGQQDILDRRTRLENGGVVDRIRDLTEPDSRVWLQHAERRQRVRELARGAEIAALLGHTRRATKPLHPVVRPAYRQFRKLRHALSPISGALNPNERRDTVSK